MKQTMRLAITLAVYTVVACFALAAVYNFTAPKIEQIKADKAQAALQAVFPEADNFDEITDKITWTEEKIKLQTAYEAMKDGKSIGLTITMAGPTYAKAVILMAVNPDDTIKEINFLELSDTPGLGSKAAEEPFISQFNGKALNSPFTVNDDVNAIGGATITSNGVSAILRAGARAAEEYRAKNQ